VNPAAIVAIVLVVSHNVMAITIFLPSMASMAAALSVELASVQRSVSLYTAMFGGFQLFMGPLVDCYGAKRILILVLVCSAIASIIAGSANVFLGFLAVRIIQAGMVSGCMVATRAQVRARTDEDVAARINGIVLASTALCPGLFQAVGGALNSIWGWRSTFYFMAGYTVLCLFMVCFALPGTHDSSTERRRVLPNWRTYAALLRRLSFLGYVAAGALLMAGNYLFLTQTPVLLFEIFFADSILYGVAVTTTSVALLLGYLMSIKFGVKLGVHDLLLLATSLMSAAAILLLCTGLLGACPMLAAFIAMMALWCVAYGALLPSIMARAVGEGGRDLGAAAALSGSAQMFGGAAGALLASYLPISLDAFYLSMGVLAAFISVIMWRVVWTRRVARAIDLKSRDDP
jgi:DHA1 family bicyclomycin/chloramphenicol resistance-like MFS transporter